mgnify:CR=1 FL=1
MTAAQRARRAEREAVLGRPDPRAVETGMADLLRLVVDDEVALVAELVDVLAENADAERVKRGYYRLLM